MEAAQCFSDPMGAFGEGEVCALGGRQLLPKIVLISLSRAMTEQYQ